MFATSADSREVRQPALVPYWVTKWEDAIPLLTGQQTEVVTAAAVPTGLPFGVKEGSFLVDLSRLGHHLDIFNDSYSVWGPSSGDTILVAMQPNGQYKIVSRRATAPPGVLFDFKMTRYRLVFMSCFY